MLADLVLMACFTGITVIYTIILNGDIHLTGKQQNMLLELFSIVNYEKLLMILLGSIFFTIIIYTILIFVSELRWLLSHIFKSVLISFVLIPGLLLLVENLVALAAGAIFCVIFIIVLFMIGNVLRDAGSSETGGAASGSIVSAPKPKKEVKQIEKTPKIKEIEVASGFPLYLGEGTGVIAPKTTCIFTDTTVQKRVFLCTYKDFQEGKVIIKKGGKPITRLN